MASSPFLLLFLIFFSSFLLSSLVFPSPIFSPVTPLRIGICVTVSEYDSHIIEWMEYHLIIGVDQFYFYFDPRYNHSEEGLSVALSTYISDGILTLSSRLPVNGYLSQPHTLDACLRDYSNAAAWLAFVDLDEYIVCADTEEVKRRNGAQRRDCLRRLLLETDPYRDSPGILINEKRFTSVPYSDTSRPPPHGYLVPLTLHHFLPDLNLELERAFYKIIVNTRHSNVSQCRFNRMDIYHHNCFWKSNTTVVTGDGEFMDPKEILHTASPYGFKTAFSRPPSPPFRFHHYYYYSCFENFHKRVVEREKEIVIFRANEFKRDRKAREKAQEALNGISLRVGMKRGGEEEGWVKAAKVRSDPCICEEWGRRENLGVDRTIELYSRELQMRVTAKRNAQWKRSGLQVDVGKWIGYQNISLNCSFV